MRWPQGQQLPTLIHGRVQQSLDQQLSPNWRLRQQLQNWKVPALLQQFLLQGLLSSDLGLALQLGLKARPGQALELDLRLVLALPLPEELKNYCCN